MRNLARPLLRLLGRDDRGAIGVLVAVLVAGGVLLGTGALVIDVGQIYQNRAELQNGADSAALAIAEQCGQQQGACPPTASSTAQTYTSANASALTGHSNGVVAVCGSGGLDACSDYPSIFGPGLTSCPPDPANLAAGAGFVDVATSTKLANGSTLLPPVFARTLLGNSSYDGTNVKACAQAEWGTAAEVTSLALTISVCQWNELTGSGGSGFGVLTAVYLKGATSCTGPAGLNMPGGFTWLQTTGTNPCTASIDLATDTTYSSTGTNVSSGCKTALQNDINNQTTIFVPVFGCPDPPVAGCPVSGTGINAQYYIIGLASFVVVGYWDIDGQGNTGANNYGNYSLCTSQMDPCLEGEFEPGLSPVSDYLNTTTSYGFSVKSVRLTG